MLKWLHMYNLEGKQMWAGSFVPETGETDEDCAKQILADVPAQLIGWCAHDAQGTFAMGPLLGLVFIRDHKEDLGLDGFKVAAVVEQANKHPVAEYAL